MDDKKSKALQEQILDLQEEVLRLQIALSKSQATKSKFSNETIVSNIVSSMKEMSKPYALRYANVTFTRAFFEKERDIELRSAIAAKLCEYFEGNKAANKKIWEHYI